MKRITITLLIAIAVSVGSVLVWLMSNSRGADETPGYKVIRSDGKFEVRDYPPLTLAGTSMDGDARDGSFMRLFRFIDGGNDASEKIPMTTPVLIDTSPEKQTMNFIMPEQTAAKGVPRPSEDGVLLANTEAGRFAVLRFGGGRNAQNEAQAITKLRAWLNAQKLAEKGAPVFAYYDPPWTPVFMRRNEVMIRIEE